MGKGYNNIKFIILVLKIFEFSTYALINVHVILLETIVTEFFNFKCNNNYCKIKLIQEMPLKEGWRLIVFSLYFQPLFSAFILSLVYGKIIENRFEKKNRKYTLYFRKEACRNEILFRQET